MFAGELQFFPLVVLTTRGALTSGDVDDMTAFYREVHGRRVPFLHVVDGRGALRPDSVVRARLAELTANTLAETRLYQVANAIVLDSRLNVGVMTALRWAIPAPVPEQYFADIKKAAAWLGMHGAARGVELSAEAAAFLQQLDRQPIAS